MCKEKSKVKVARRIAVNRLVFPDGRVELQQVVELDAHGQMVGHHPLTTEEPFTEWLGGDWNVNV